LGQSTSGDTPQNTEGAPETPELETLTVTATRVSREGYTAPTPTTVVNLADIQRQAPANLADVINELPAITASSTNTTQNAFGPSAQGQGMNLLNLRDLGPNRTLVLLDGARAVPSNSTLNVDINLLPTELVQRVDVVTGGASADWGSDAVAGVVNFILDKNFTGLKGFVQGGESEYGDGANTQVGLTFGTGFLSDRGHFEISGKFSDQEQVGGATATGRDWYQGWKVLGNPNGSATDVMLPHVGLSSATDGGLIVSGPLKGTQFVGATGTPQPFNFGSVSGQESVGGSAEDDGGRIQLENPQREGSLFSRVSYDITEGITAYAEGTYAQSSLQIQSVPYNRLGNITILSGNAYLPASIQSSMTAKNMASFTLGKINQQLGFTLLDDDTDVSNIKGGLTGKFGGGWAWNVYYQHGRNGTLSKAENDGIIANYNAAVDAVVNPATGTIVCRSTLAAPSNGCQPFDPFGTAAVSSAVKNYITGTGSQKTDIGQDDVEADVRGNPFSTWAGPVSIATGVEYRKESYSVVTDPISQANGYFIGFGTPASGSYNVTEGFLETVAPLLSAVPLAKEVDLNAAVRETDYSISGSVTTWKVGLTDEVNDDIRLRATRSTDIRAPNLQDLFATGITAQNALTDPVTGKAYQVAQVTSGSRSLTPEVAHTTSGGIVLRWARIPGLSASIDYFRIDIDNAITTPTAQQVVNQCAAGNAEACAFITRGPTNLITKVAITPLNVQSETTHGIDLAASYRLDLARAGALTLKALATDTMDHTIKSLGSATQYAGTNGDGVFADPRWRGLMSTTYDLGGYSGTLTARYIGSGVISNKTPTIVNNDVPSIVYFDLSSSYQVKAGLQVYGVIENLLDKAPPPSPQITSTQQLNIGVDDYIYDTIGRQFRLGVRFSF